MEGTGGIRKLRWARDSKGKSRWARAFRAHAERVCDAKWWAEKRCPPYI